METPAVTVATLVGTVGTVFEAAIGWVGTVATTIAGTPMLLLFASIPLIGLGVGLFRRLMNVN